VAIHPASAADNHLDCHASLAMTLQVAQARPQLRTMSKRKDSLLGLAVTG